MTTAEKAIAYDKALERAKLAIKECGDNKGRISMIESIFPELGESEDERIRKMLIDSFTRADMGGEIYGKGVTYKQVIAWLEKQVTSYTKRDVDDAYLKGVTDTKNEIEKQYEANYQIRKDIATFIFNYRGDIKDRAKWMDYLGIKVYFVEKQGEQKFANSAKTCKSEQELSDKVEPKLRKGNWVVFNNKHKSVYQIEKIENFQYTLRHILGGSMPLSFSHEDMISLWTIQDAKDGDVLDANGAPFIYKKHDKDYVYFYCGVNLGGYFIEASASRFDTWNNNNKVYPATKEQRDTLFKAMADAGYTFNFDKKSLKKIEQKPAWSEEDELNIKEITKAIYFKYKDTVQSAGLECWLQSLKDRLSKR